MKLTRLPIALMTVLTLTMANASAATLTVTGMEYANPATVHTKTLNPATDRAVYSGAFLAKEGMSTFEAWCADIFQNTIFNSPASDFVLKAASAVVGQQKADLLGRLATESLGLVNSSTTSSAFQLAMWELLNETAGNPFNLSAGNFRAYGASDSSITLAQTWLDNLPSASTYKVKIYESASRQDLAVFSKVPEPLTPALIAAGLLALAATTRKRKTHV
jgi:hypothetical protein